MFQCAAFRIVEFSSGPFACRGAPAVPANLFFTEDVELVSACARTGASHNTRVTLDGDVCLSGSGVPLTDTMRRQLVVDADVRILSICSIRWLHELPSMGALSGLVRLHLKDLDIDRLPDLSPLDNLSELHLESLHAMSEIPDTVCDAPRLCTLNLTELLGIARLPGAFVRRLAAKAAPLRVLRMTRCGFEAPAELGALTGLTVLHLEDRVTDPHARALPDRLPDLSGLTSLHTLKIKDYPYVCLHEDQAALPALTTLTYKDDSEWNDHDSGERLVAFVAGSTALTKLNVAHVGLASLPARLAGLAALRTLKMRGLAITRLDGDIAALEHLASLTVRECPYLGHFGAAIIRQCKRLRYLVVDLMGNPNPRVGWQLIACVPDMAALDSLAIVRLPRDDQVSALVDALWTWPLRRELAHASFDTLFFEHWNHHEYWDTAGGATTPLPANWRYLGGAERSHVVVSMLRGQRQRLEQRRTAFVMGAHARLGAASPVAALDEAVLLEVLAAVAAARAADFAEAWAWRVADGVAGPAAAVPDVPDGA